MTLTMVVRTETILLMTTPIQAAQIRKATKMVAKIAETVVKMTVVKMTPHEHVVENGIEAGQTQLT